MLSNNDINEYFKARDKMIENQYSFLNPMQRKAVLTIGGPLLILAGAGSGKTSVLVNRAAHMLRFGDSYESGHLPLGINFDLIAKMKELSISGGEITHQIDDLFKDVQIPPNRIMAITFTNKAAREMKERLGKMIGLKAEAMWIATFHSACVKILRKNIHRIGYTNDFVIYDDADQEAILKECIKELNFDDKMFSYKEAKAIIGRQKDKMVTHEVFLRKSNGNFREEKFALIYKLYEEKLKKNNALDFDNLINKTIELFELYPEALKYYTDSIKYIMVDEYQDTNYPQYKLIKLLVGNNNNVCVVGDDDQSIYGWRGADIRNILEFEKDFNCRNIIKLEQNYRSTQNILEAANSVIKNNDTRKHKNLWTSNSKGEKIVIYRALTEYYEAEFVCSQIKKMMGSNEAKNEDFAILYRTNAQSRVLEESLIRYGIKYKIYGGIRFYGRKEIKDLIAYLRLILNLDDNVSLRRIINSPKRGIGLATMEEIGNEAGNRQISYFQVVCAPESLSLRTGRTSSKLRDFAELILRFNRSKDSMAIADLITEVLSATGYVRELERERTDDALDRIQNLDEFLNASIEYIKANQDATLRDFLESIALMSDTDNEEGKDNAVLLMTIHSAKGLEFPVVFLSGMEEGLFPISRALQSLSELEEERRLCYVAITRAKRQLFVTHSDQRTIHGMPTRSIKSRFIEEISEECIVKHQLNRQSNFVESSQVNRNIKINPVSPAKTYRIGEAVIHSKFGKGIITDSNGSGSEQSITISFEHGGNKVFLSELAPLSKV